MRQCCSIAPLQGSAAHSLWLAAFGAAAGAAFLGWALAAGWDVLAFPQQKRPRYRLLREQLPAGDTRRACLNVGFCPGPSGSELPPSVTAPQW
jgi:hypothetical protein